jgi:hypothetical protein
MAINTKLQNIIDTKTAIGAAIVNKGGIITNATPFYNYAAEIDGLTIGGGGGGDIPNYVNAVVRDTNGAKYTVRDGFDYVTNPTPNINAMPFNQWELNNATTRPILYNNVQMEIKYYNGPNSVINEGNMATFINRASITNTFSRTYSYPIVGYHTVNIIGFWNSANNTAINMATLAANNTIYNATVLNGFHYFIRTLRTSPSSGNTQNTTILSKVDPENRTFLVNTSLIAVLNLPPVTGRPLGSDGYMFVIFNDFFHKRYENLVLIANTSSSENDLVANNIYTYTVNNTMTKQLHSANLVEITNIAVPGQGIVYQNNYVYIASEADLFKYSNDLSTLIGSSTFSSNIINMATDDLFIYFDVNGEVKKVNPNTLQTIGTTTGVLRPFISNNSFFVFNSGQ